MGTGCQVQFVALSTLNVTSATDPRGRCLGSCEPQATPVSLMGDIRAPFSTGNILVDPTSIIGLRWRVPISCGVAARIDDIKFVNP